MKELPLQIQRIMVRSCLAVMLSPGAALLHEGPADDLSSNKSQRISYFCVDVPVAPWNIKALCKWYSTALNIMMCSWLEKKQLNRGVVVAVAVFHSLLALSQAHMHTRTPISEKSYREMLSVSLSTDHNCAVMAGDSLLEMSAFIVNQALHQGVCLFGCISIWNQCLDVWRWHHTSF